jgi:hypothetical protein
VIIQHKNLHGTGKPPGRTRHAVGRHAAAGRAYA